MHCCYLLLFQDIGNNENKKCIHHASSEIRGANLSFDLHITQAHELMMMVLKCQEAVRI